VPVLGPSNPLHMRAQVPMTSVPLNPDTLLTRVATAMALTAAGYPISPATLATKASRGGGPLYSRFAGRTLYRWGDAIDWAKSNTYSPARGQAQSGSEA